MNNEQLEQFADAVFAQTSKYDYSILRLVLLMADELLTPEQRQSLAEKYRQSENSESNPIAKSIHEYLTKPSL